MKHSYIHRYISLSHIPLFYLYLKFDFVHIIFFSNLKKKVAMNLFSSFNLIFLPAAASEIQVWNWLYFQTFKLDMSRKYIKFNLRMSKIKCILIRRYVGESAFMCAEIALIVGSKSFPLLWRESAKPTYLPAGMLLLSYKITIVEF